MSDETMKSTTLRARKWDSPTRSPSPFSCRSSSASCVCWRECGGAQAALTAPSPVQPCIVARTEMIYDVTGAITYVLCAAFSYLARDQTGHLRAHIATLLVVLWAARLGTFLFLRIRKDGEDRRFRRIRNDPIKFFVVWMMQGLWICIVSLPLWLLNLGSNALPVAPVEYIGTLFSVFATDAHSWLCPLTPGRRPRPVDFWIRARGCRRHPKVRRCPSPRAHRTPLRFVTQ